MSRPFRLLAVTACAALLVACAPKGEQEPAATALTTDQQKFGYAVGVNLGQSLTQVKDEVDIASLKRGLDDAMGGAQLAMTDEEREQIHQLVAERVQAKAVVDRQAKSDAAKAKGEAFLAENGKREGVTTTASGLQYEVQAPGEGTSPKASDSVTVHYRGTLIDGTEFDSSIARGEPVTFPLDGVIPGWTEGVQLMKPGAKFKFVIPAALAYGERGAGQAIGPNETLIFDVELLSVGEPADSAE